MYVDKGTLLTDVALALNQKGFKLAPNAMEPLDQIDFGKLVDIHDHEERFLRSTFIEILIGLALGRVSSIGGPGEITGRDVKTAVLMLGIAAARQDEPILSTNTKGVIKDSCGFC